MANDRSMGGEYKIAVLMEAPINVLKCGRKNSVKAMASAMESTVVRKDSVMNCLTRLLFKEPNTFLTPTSRARLADLAVDRFMKLIQAIKRMNTAMAVNI